MGGAGADNLKGGAGNDVYLYTSLSDSTNDARDTIGGFDVTDIIDLSAFGALSYIGEVSAFTSAGQVRYWNNKLWVHTTGTTAPEMVIQVATDFAFSAANLRFADNTAPPLTLASVNEVSGTGGAFQIAFTVDSSDPEARFSAQAGGAHNYAFSVDALRGYVTLTYDPVIVGPVTYDLTILARDFAGNATSMATAVTLGDVTDGDTITGSASARNFMYGFAGADSLTGGSAGDYIYGGDGDDTLVGGDGSDYLDGGAGIDTASYAGSSSGINANLGAGDDTLVNIENVTGGNGNDVISGNAANNNLAGGAGNDTISGGDGDDTLDGGADTDTVTYASAGSAVTVSLAGGSATGGAGSDTLSNFENVVGSIYGDNITGDGGANDLNGGAGGDTITGGGDDDTIVGGDGADSIDGGAGNDSIALGSDSAVDTVAIAFGGANGVDVISGFGTGVDDVLAFTGANDAGSGTETHASVNNTTSSGSIFIASGTGLVVFDTAVYAPAALTDVVVSYFLSDINLDAGTTQQVLFGANNDVFYLAIGNGTDTGIFRVATDGSIDGGLITSNEVTLIATLTGIGNAASLQPANFSGF